MKLNVIITTYNRPQKVKELITMLLSQLSFESKIIVVDSSNDYNNEIANIQNVLYIKSSHKNQPYQRYLGYKLSKAEWLLFLDDDMEPLQNMFDVLKRYISKMRSIGFFAINNIDKDNNTFVLSQDKSIFSKYQFKLIRSFFGYPILKEGEYSFNGNKGIQPKSGGYTNFGARAFLVKKDFIFSNFNMQLFDIFEKRFGMGEDTAITYTVSKETDMYFIPEILFIHNDQSNSVYSSNLINYYRNVVFSRFFLTMDYARLNKKNYTLTKFYFFWYVLWRFISVIFNLLIKQNKVYFFKLTGYFYGILLLNKYKFDKNLTINNYWNEHILFDIDKYNK